MQSYWSEHAYCRNDLMSNLENNLETHHLMDYNNKLFLFQPLIDQLCLNDDIFSLK